MQKVPQPRIRLHLRRIRSAICDCADEVEALEQVFRPIKGVREVRVNLMGGKVTLFHDESACVCAHSHNKEKKKK